MPSWDGAQGLFVVVSVFFLDIRPNGPSSDNGPLAFVDQKVFDARFPFGKGIVELHNISKNVALVSLVYARCAVPIFFRTSDRDTRHLSIRLTAKDAPKKKKEIPFRGLAEVVRLTLITW